MRLGGEWEKGWEARLWGSHLGTSQRWVEAPVGKGRSGAYTGKGQGSLVGKVGSHIGRIRQGVGHEEGHATTGVCLIQDPY